MHTPDAANALARWLRLAPAIPVVVIDDATQALPLARALVAGGLPVIEVTLRTAAADAAIAALVSAPRGWVVGAGTVTGAADIARMARLGVQFCVSPGITPALLDAAEAHAMPLLPGVQTASEILLGRERGLDCFKFFPAAQAGGIAMLEAWHGPFADVLFCPTGGISPDNAPAFLRLGNVAAVGSSWVAPRAAIAAGQWTAITERARTAAHWR
ncbi:MAG: bifunctional 4-hydroxy-2-oxoglutarate aldolase/2-dehydro-3-deoxy-phosphogluconate aldolase [Gammaproteobacteria bacterium]